MANNNHYVREIYDSLEIEYKTWKARKNVQMYYSYGDKNKDKKFFIITCNNPANGIYSTIFYILPFIDYAIKKRYIPIIDFKNCYLPLLQDEENKGIENAWEYYYEQPMNEFSLEEVYQSKNVIKMVEGKYRTIKWVHWDEMFPTSADNLMYWNGIINKYIRLNDSLKTRIEEEKKIFIPGKKILGVSIRMAFRAGMLNNMELFNDHPKVDSCETYIKIIEKKLIEWKYDYIFLTTDDRECLEKFKEYFQDKCIYIERPLAHFFQGGKNVKDISERYIELQGVSVEERTKEYITETYLLAKCNSLYSCIGGAGKWAYFVNGGKYEHLEVYNEGVYSGLG